MTLVVAGTLEEQEGSDGLMKVVAGSSKGDDVGVGEHLGREIDTVARKRIDCHLTSRGGKVGDGDTDWGRPVTQPFITQGFLPGYLQLNQVLGVWVKHEVRHSCDVYAGSAAEAIEAGGGGGRGGGGGGGREVKRARREGNV